VSCQTISTRWTGVSDDISSACRADAAGTGLSRKIPTIPANFTSRNTRYRRSRLHDGYVHLGTAELNLFVAACADGTNVHAQQLLNVFGTETAEDVLVQLCHAPIGIFADLVSNIWFAILYEAARRDPMWAEVLERVLS
jgi:hypothetical protein